jgi:hypothetical protein
MLTDVPPLTIVPAPGLSLITLPDCTVPLYSFVTVPKNRPEVVMAVVAAACADPTTLGTATFEKAKLAETLVAALTLTVHIALVPEHGLPQPVNADPGYAFAVSVTCVPLGSLSEHVPVTIPPLIAQLIAGIAEEFDFTVPLPEPVSVRVNV